MLGDTIINLGEDRGGGGGGGGGGVGSCMDPYHKKETAKAADWNRD